MAVRAIRGATRVDVDAPEQVLQATRELLRQLLDANGLAVDDVISILFTATRDLSSQAPALAARQLGLAGVALLCAQEMEVPGSMPRVVRLMAHVETERTRAELCHVYLRGTEVLRAMPETATGTGAVDTGAVDSGAMDSGAMDSGATDSGATDSAATDTGATDSAATDTGARGGGPG